MICPNCGETIDDDKLMCENCGAEISFVPEFDPEIEQTIDESLSNIQVDEFYDSYYDTPNQEEVFGYYDENGNFVETPGYFDENGEFVELQGYYDASGNFIQTVTMENEDGILEEVPGFIDENGEVVLFDINDDDVLGSDDFIDFEAENATVPAGNKTNSQHRSSVRPGSSKRTLIKDANGVKHPVNKNFQSKALEGISAPERGPKVTRNLSDTLYDEMFSDSTLTEYDKDYEIDPFDEFGYESYYLKKFGKFIIHSKFKWVFLITLVIIILLGYKAITSISERVMKDNSYEYQVELANEAVAQGNYEQAIVYMEKALSLNSKSSSLKYTLADYYFKVGDNDNGLYMLWEIINQNDANCEAAYSRMITYYADLADYGTIETILENCQLETIKVQYSDYLAEPPVFSIAEGTYEDAQYLELFGGANGTIYYTTDGTEPSTESDVYTTALFLDKGIMRVTAMYVNSYGISSEIVAKTYTIDKRIPNAPIVLTEEGDYEIPKLIEVDVQSYTDVYYTLDGTIPSMNSSLYLSPIPMPIGTSTIMFVAYSQEGVAGEVTSVTYNLTVDTILDVPGVINQLYVYNKNIGRAQDYQGNILGGSTFQYTVSQAIVLNDDIFYIFVESINDMSGKNSRTGNIFLVSTTNGSIWKGNKDTMQNITLGELIDPELYTTVETPEDQNNNDPNSEG